MKPFSNMLNAYAKAYNKNIIEEALYSWIFLNVRELIVRIIC